MKTLERLLMLTLLTFIAGLVLVLDGQSIGAALQQPTILTSLPGFSAGYLDQLHGGTGNNANYTVGSVPFGASPNFFAEDNANFFYNSSSHCLSVGSNTCGTAATILQIVRTTNGTVAVFQNTNAGNQLQFNVNNATGAAILQNRNTANSTNLPLVFQSQGGAVLIPPLASVSGTRTLCIATDGTISSSATPCVGT